MGTAVYAPHVNVGERNAIMKQANKLSRMRCLMVVAVFCVVPAVDVSATTYLVRADGTGDYTAIQEAIDATTDGDVVEISDGTYAGAGNKNLDFGGKAITVRSVSGNPALCIIDCENDGRGLFFFRGEGSDSIINGLTIMNGALNQSSPGGNRGGGVFCWAGSSPTLINCRIIGNSATDYGGGVYCSGGSPTLVNCIIGGNSADCGGGIHCEWSSNPTITNCTIVDNSANYGGGIYCWNSSPTLTNCVSWSNTPQEVYNDLGNPVVTYCDVQGGTGEPWFGRGCIDSDPLFAFPNDFHLMSSSPCIDAGTNGPFGGLPFNDADGNPRSLDGDGDSIAIADMGAFEFTPLPWIWVTPVRLEFHALVGEENPDYQTLLLRNAGGGMLNWEVAETCPWLEANPLSGDSSGEVDEVTLSVDISDLTQDVYSTVLEIMDPQAINSPHEVIVTLTVGPMLDVPSEYPTIQAAIDASTNGDMVRVADGTYFGNGNKSLDFGGKAITVCSASGNPALCIIDCENGGCGFRFHSGEGPNSIVEGMMITNGSYGISCEGSSPTLTNCVISGNSTSQNGGGVYCSYSSPTLANCVISGNSTSQNGGGVYCSYSSPTLTNCTIAGNSASDDGGGIYCVNSSPTLTNCILWGDAPHEVYIDSGDPVVTYCDVQDGTDEPWFGTGCIDLDPLFAFADDVHLMSGSPCVDAGTNGPSGGLPADDLDGNQRSLDGDGDTLAIVDMGAYELNPASAPLIAMNSAVFEFYGSAGGEDPGDQVLSLRNAGGGTLDWEVTETCPWLEANPLSGDSTGEIDDVILSVNVTGLTLGYYACLLTVSDLDAVNSPRELSVTLDVTGTLAVPGEYLTIQEAIDAANPGDEIVVADGTYTGTENKNLDFGGKAITVRSASGNPGLCIIDCENDGGGFDFHSGEGSSSVVEGIMVTNGGYYGVACVEASSPTLTNCTLSGNYDSGVFCLGGSPTLTNCTITGNVGGYGGGVLSVGDSGTTLTNCTISGNFASGWGSESGFGGGVYCGGILTLNNCILWGNTATAGLQISTDPGATIIVSSSCIQGGWMGSSDIYLNPTLTPAGHLRANSPCIDAGSNGLLPADVFDLDADDDVAEPIPFDIDGEARVVDGVVDIGADEFLDTDTDGLPDWWETLYSADLDAGADIDNDGLTNLEEYEEYGSNPTAAPYYVDGTNGNDNWNGLYAVFEPATSNGPKRTIQAALDLANDGDTVLVLPGTYSGMDNKELDYAGKSAVLRATDGPAETTIDCESSGQVVSSNSFKSTFVALEGFTITGGSAELGGAVQVNQSRFMMKNCVLVSNSATVVGGGVYADLVNATFDELTLESNTAPVSTNGLISHSNVHLQGNLNVEDRTLDVCSSIFYGPGELYLGEGSLLHIGGDEPDAPPTLLQSNVKGTGNIRIDLGQSLYIERGAVIDLSGATTNGCSDPSEAEDWGTIFVDGNLVVREATIRSTNVEVSLADFEDAVGIINNDIALLEASAGFGGEFFVEGRTVVECNSITSYGDRYLDLDPDPNALPDDRPDIRENRFHVIITQGVQGERGETLELRSPDLDCDPMVDTNGCSSGAVQLASGFGYEDTWVLETLEVRSGAKVNLTNRQGFEFAVSSNGLPETVYVKELKLYPDAVLNTGLQRMYYQNLRLVDSNGFDMSSNGAEIVDVPLLGFSLKIIAMEDEEEFAVRVRRRLRDPDDQQPLPTEEPKEGSIELAEYPMQGGVMEMRTRAIGLQSASSVAAKGAFARAGDERITVTFEYLFVADPHNDAELIVYLSDHPEASKELVELARIRPPQPGRPGAIGSGQMGVFDGTFNRGQLNFTRGTYVELELRGQDARIWIDDWDPYIGCIHCGNVDGWPGIDSGDFLTVLASVGTRTYPITWFNRIRVL